MPKQKPNMKAQSPQNISNSKQAPVVVEDSQKQVVTIPNWITTEDRDNPEVYVRQKKKRIRLQFNAEDKSTLKANLVPTQLKDLTMEKFSKLAQNSDGLYRAMAYDCKFDQLTPIQCSFGFHQKDYADLVL